MISTASPVRFWEKSHFFHGRKAAVVSHGFTKERRVRPTEIQAAIDRKKRFESDPKKHTFKPKG